MIETGKGEFICYTEAEKKHRLGGQNRLGLNLGDLKVNGEAQGTGANNSTLTQDISARCLDSLAKICI